MRGTFVFRDGALIPKHQAAPLVRGPRSGLPAPMLIRDAIDPLMGMHDGKLYDSKSALRASYRAAGVEELGNDAPLEARDNSKPITAEEVGEAYRKVRDGYKPQLARADAAPVEISTEMLAED